MENLRVLIVDDEQGIRRGIRKALRNYTVELSDFDTKVGFDLSEADCGSTALAALEREDFDLMLLDYKLGDMTGLDILTRIKNMPVDVTTIMITAFASLEVAVSTTKNGAYDFLAKPFAPEELKSVIKKAARSVLVHRHAQKLEDEKRKVRFQFISVLVHELKAPLGIIEGYLYLLQDRVLGDDVNAYDKYITRTIDRMAGMRKLIFDILDLTRLESGQKKRELKDLDILDFARDSMEVVSEDARKNNITLNLEAPDQIPFHGDASEMSIIFNNLLTNAVKYNREYGRVDIRLSHKRDVVTIEVQDTGIGMSESEQEQLFTEFTRIKNEKTKNILGSGLGLSILKQLAGFYHGTISVKSEPDVGSTFTLTLIDKK